jgi:hypothetical protein
MQQQLLSRGSKQCSRTSVARTNHMLGAEECFVNDMQAPVLLVNEIREVLARVVKLENAIESLTVSTHNAQAHQWDAIQSVKGEIQQLHQEQRDFQAVLQTNLNNSRSPLLSPKCSPISSKEPSPEQHCGFPQCTVQLSAPNRSCSAAQSLRHMIDCPRCPDGQRFLHIAQHMLKFQKSPRVVPVDVCCWCGQNFETLVTSPNDTPDARSRHRKSCQKAVINRLQDPNDRDAAAQMLADIWCIHEDSHPASKRSRDSTPLAVTTPRRIQFNVGDQFLPEHLLGSTDAYTYSDDVDAHHDWT